MNVSTITTASSEEQRERACASDVAGKLRDLSTKMGLLRAGLVGLHEHGSLGFDGLSDLAMDIEDEIDAQAFECVVLYEKEKLRLKAQNDFESKLRFHEFGEKIKKSFPMKVKTWKALHDGR